MTEIKIKSLVLDNFKCHKHLQLNLNGRNASIYGDNASGKTTIYDALTWLMFGKDSHGNGEKNVEVKPLGANGEVRDHDAMTMVEAVLLVNGMEVSLRRTYKEVWSTKRGSSQATYDGNTSEYYVDGVPCKRNVFQEKIRELVEEDTFRMLTSVNHFASGISWQARREVLFELAGVMDDKTILASDPKFLPLIEGMGRLTLAEYKKKLAAEKKNFTGVKDQTPARISECEKTLDSISGIDFEQAKAEKAELEAQYADCTTQILAIRNNTAVQQKQADLRSAQAEMTSLEAENRTYRAGQSTGAPNVAALRAGVTTLEAHLASKERQRDQELCRASSLDKQIEGCRAGWVAVNKEVFTGGTCYTCGQPLPADRLKKAQDAFEADKQRRLQGYIDQSATLKASKAAAETNAANMTEEIQKLAASIEEQKRAIADAEANVIVIVDMPDYAQRKEALSARIDTIGAELMDMQTDASAAAGALEDQKAAIDGQIRALAETIGKEVVREMTQRRVAELRDDASNAAEALEAIESQLALMDEFSRYKTQFVEESINGMFRLAKFRLFREQANGGVEERCDVVYEGVPYLGVNNAMQINLGIDIINTISRAYGVTVPLFVDNAESVTKLEASASQVIRLVVSEFDKELRVNYESL